MLAFAARRLLVSLGLVCIVASLVFMVIHVIPGDPAELLLSQGGIAPDPAAVEELRERLGLNEPLWTQYVTYMSGLLRGDFGLALQDEHPIVDEIALRLPRTLELVGAAGLLAVLFGVPLGVAAALRAGSLLDRILSAWAGFALSVRCSWSAHSQSWCWRSSSSSSPPAATCLSRAIRCGIWRCSRYRPAPSPSGSARLCSA
jgi:peptide/nickel transport system permease protein